VDDALYFLNEGFWESPWLVIAFLVSVFLVVVLRYLVSASLYHFTIFRWTRRKPITTGGPPVKQRRREIIWSLSSSLVFTMLGVGCFYMWQQGFTKVYTNTSDYSTGYFLFSIILILLLYETYYYWLHRWMHHPRVFRIVHKVHHESIHTSVYTSFSFHPLEAFLQFLFLPVVVMTFPVHYYALAIVLMFMTVSAVINHAGVEIFPKKFADHPIGRWLIGATHHDIHHKQFRTNFGLYFTFWDKLMKTESTDFPAAFENNTEAKAECD
jgi:Delta7-sterol 5-desaturase